MHAIPVRFESRGAGVVTLERRAVSVKCIAIRLDHNSLSRPEKIDQATLDHDIDLRQRKAGSSTESEKIDLQRRDGLNRPGIYLERCPS